MVIASRRIILPEAVWTSPFTTHHYGPGISPDLHHHVDVIKNNILFKEAYDNSQLPIFHYLINHPNTQINQTTFANMIVRDDGEIFSIDHEGCLKKGLRTPNFSTEQTNPFFPDTDSDLLFKQLNLTDEVNSIFNPIAKRYDKTLNDFEFRKNHILRQYETLHSERV